MPINRAFQRLKKPRKDGFLLYTIYSVYTIHKHTICCVLKQKDNKIGEHMSSKYNSYANTDKRHYFYLMM